MSRRGGAGGTYARVGLATVIGGAAVAAILAQAQARDTVPGREKVLARIRKAKGVAGLDKAAGNTSTSNAGLGVLLGPPPAGVDWATSEPKVPEGLALPTRMVIGTGGGRSAIPLSGELADWLTKSSGSHVSSVIDKAIRASPPLRDNSQADRRGDLISLRALTGQVTNISKLADFLETAGYTSTFGACDLTLKAVGDDTRLALASSLSGTTVHINTVDWANRATHKAVTKLLQSLTRGGTPENKKRLQVIDTIGKNLGVTGFPRLQTALKAHKFLEENVPMVRDTNQTPLQLGKQPLVLPESEIINAIAAAPSPGDAAAAVVAAAIKSQPAEIDPQKAAAFGRLKALSDAAKAAAFANIPPDLEALVQWMDLVQWTHTKPDFSKLNQVPDQPFKIWLYQEVDLQDPRAWIQSATNDTVDQLVDQLTDTTSPTFLRFKLTQVLQDPGINAAYANKPGTLFSPASTKPSYFGKWAITAGWLRPVPPPLSKVTSAPLNLKTPFHGASFVWQPTDAGGGAGAGAVNFSLQYAWSSPPGAAGDRPGQTLQSLFMGPTLAGGDPPVGLAGPVNLTNGTGWVEVKPEPPAVTGQIYTSGPVTAAYKAAETKLEAQLKAIAAAVSA